MPVTSTDIKKLREETGAGVMECQKALKDASGDYKKALALVAERGLARAERKQDRETKEGYLASYVHSHGKTAALVELVCETDFVARNEEFRNLGREIAMQVVAMEPETVEELLAQESIREAGKTIEQMVKGLSGKIGEKIAVTRFVRYEIGK